MKLSNLFDGITVSIAPGLEFEGGPSKSRYNKKRIFTISVIAILNGMVMSGVARILVWLINLVTNIAFYGKFSLDFHSPALNHLGLWILIIPVIGGLLVGMMALYGSKAIRGHGIPEAMEMILSNESKIKPEIAFLKPVSAAIAIGTGGPFGAEGPIIATGGALGSTLGQLFRISPNERKVLLAAGATAGMSAVFGTPLAAIFLAIELLLFEFSPRSIIPVALACITGAAGHHLFFESAPVFLIPVLPAPSNPGLAVYSLIGLVIGFISLGLTKAVYFIEDSFEKLPIHWFWWPAIGGFAVGLIGYFAPHTLGVGYDNIIGLLSGSMSLNLVLSLCIFKFLSWAIALGSGTSGGTLAPLFTIGGATGALLGMAAIRIFPGAGILIPFAVLVGMSAMFAGASRAFMTSVIFSLESTMQAHALLPLLAACTAAYLVSFFFMKNTLMTEKIARRGVITPDSFESDPLEKILVSDVLSEDVMIFSSEATIGEVRTIIKDHNTSGSTFIIVTERDSSILGMMRETDLFVGVQDLQGPVKLLITTRPVSVLSNASLRVAVQLMSVQDTEILPVVKQSDRLHVIGVLTYKDILGSYRTQVTDNQEAGAHISLNRRRLKMLIKGRRLLHERGLSLNRNTKK